MSEKDQDTSKMNTVMINYDFQDKSRWKEDAVELLLKLATEIANADDNDESYSGFIVHSNPEPELAPWDGFDDELEDEDHESESLLEDSDIVPISLPDFITVLKSVVATETDCGGVSLSLPPDFDLKAALEDEKESQED